MKLYSLLYLLLVSGCAAQYTVLDRAIIKNLTHDIISQVTVYHEPTGNFGEIHTILPQSSFELGFSRSPLLAEKAIVSWVSRNGQTRMTEIQLPWPQPGTDKSQPAVLVYSIYPNGSVTAELE